MTPINSATAKLQNITSKGVYLTDAEAAAVLEVINPVIIYYYPAQDVPKIRKDEQPSFYKVPVTPERDVWLMHPDNETLFIKAARERGFVPFLYDWNNEEDTKYRMDELLSIKPPEPLQVRYLAHFRYSVRTLRPATG